MFAACDFFEEYPALGRAVQRPGRYRFRLPDVGKNIVLRFLDAKNDAGERAGTTRLCAGISTRWDRRQKFVLTGQAGRIVRQKMRWLKANSYGAIATRVAAREGPVRPDPDAGDGD